MRGGQSPHNFREHEVGTYQGVVIPKSNHVVTARLKVLRTPIVLRNLFKMLATIQLNDESLLDANEVDDVWRKWMLPPKFVSNEVSIAEVVPEFEFRIGGVPS